MMCDTLLARRLERQLSDEGAATSKWLAAECNCTVRQASKFLESYIAEHTDITPIYYIIQRLGSKRCVQLYTKVAFDSIAKNSEVIKQVYAVHKNINEHYTVLRSLQVSSDVNTGVTNSQAEEARKKRASRNLMSPPKQPLDGKDAELLKPEMTKTQSKKRPPKQDIKSMFSMKEQENGKTKTIPEPVPMEGDFDDEDVIPSSQKRLTRRKNLTDSSNEPSAKKTFNEDLFTVDDEGTIPVAEPIEKEIEESAKEKKEKSIKHRKRADKMPVDIPSESPPKRPPSADKCIPVTSPLKKKVSVTIKEHTLDSQGYRVSKPKTQIIVTEQSDVNKVQHESKPSKQSMILSSSSRNRKDGTKDYKQKTLTAFFKK